jgi:hypothetical protein
MKRHTKLIVGVTVALTAASGGLARQAWADDNGPGHGNQGGGIPVTSTEPITWTMDAAACSNLPAGTTIEATGVRTLRLKSVERNGVTKETVIDHAEGTATAGGVTYNWTYDNKTTASNSAVAPSLFHGEMTDAFRLSGPGPISLRNGFAAAIFDDRQNPPNEKSFGIFPKSAFGDPFNFPFGPGRCDPI